jgi:hypothetical protein
MNSAYLPSRSFMIRAGILLGLFLVIFAIVKIIPVIRAKIAKNTMSRVLVKDVIESDSNKNGLPDWEEKLWGLDPEGDGPSNKEFINAKKKTLAASGTAEGTLSENDKVSREFFSLVMSLEESGLSNEEILAKISEEIGSQVTFISLPDAYAYKDITTAVTSKNSVLRYRDSMTLAMQSCQANGIGSEMDLVGTALNHERKDLLAGLPAIEKAYRECIATISKIKAPIELTGAHLAIMNNFEKTAEALQAVEGIFDNQIAGLSGIVSYNEYNRLAISALNSIRDYKLGAILTR